MGGTYIQRLATLRNPGSIEVGKNVAIMEHVWLNVTKSRNDGRATLIVGYGTYIERFTHINAYQDIIIAHNVQCLNADRVFISDVDHTYRDSITPITFQNPEFQRRILLCSGCWIGIRAVITLE